MASKFDASDFIDTDFSAAQTVLHAPAVSNLNRPPSREEIEGKVSDAQQKLAELRRAQEELEREKAALEEARRRRIEFQNGRQEMLQHLTRGTGLLEEAEFSARRDAEQIAKTLADLRQALTKVEELKEESWTQESYNTELTRALTTLENARMEWNSALLKWDVLSGKNPAAETEAAQKPAAPIWQTESFLELTKIGLAFTWPILLVALLGFATMIILLARR
jgi:chromosome segregation ATPase